MRGLDVTCNKGVRAGKAVVKPVSAIMHFPGGGDGDIEICFRSFGLLFGNMSTAFNGAGFSRQNDCRLKGGIVGVAKNTDGCKAF